jgi:hypothetical protein
MIELIKRMFTIAMGAGACQTLAAGPMRRALSNAVDAHWVAWYFFLRLKLRLRVHFAGIEETIS